MSIEYCHYCNKYIDIDFDGEHFESEKYGCRQEEDDNDCRLGPDCRCKNCQEETENFNPKI